MKVDLKTYETNKEFVQVWWVRKRLTVEPSMAISAMSNATMVPAIVVAFWMGEVDGWPEDIKKNVDSLNKFYGYSSINGKPENCPW